MCSNLCAVSAFGHTCNVHSVLIPIEDSIPIGRTLSNPL